MARGGVSEAVAGSPGGLTLDGAAIGQSLSVDHVKGPEDAPEWTRWLEEIGFIAGERVTLMARALPGGDPLVVRVGQSTFALRRAEAACISVVPHISSTPISSFEAAAGTAGRALDGSVA